MCDLENMKTLQQFAMTCITTGLGGLIGFYTAQRVSNLNNRRGAENSLRASFAPALAHIYIAKTYKSTHDVPATDRFLKDGSPALAAAIEVFRPFVSKNERGAYQEAWDKYHAEVCYGFDAAVCRDNMTEAAEIFEDFIHGILRFAEPQNR